jgi:hypothetical protein
MNLLVHVGFTTKVPSLPQDSSAKGRITDFWVHKKKKKKKVSQTSGAIYWPYPLMFANGVLSESRA